MHSSASEGDNSESGSFKMSRKAGTQESRAFNASTKDTKKRKTKGVFVPFMVVF
jgi:hypothetical protein